MEKFIIFLWGVFAGAASVLIATFLVWRNNKKKVEEAAKKLDEVVTDAKEKVSK